MHRLQIEPKSEGKGRVFEAHAFCIVEADSLWDGGAAKTDSRRPVFAMFAGSDAELRPFVANIVSGRLAIFATEDRGYRGKKDVKLEVLKKAGFRQSWQREPEGTIATICLPDLFQIDPGMVDPSGVRFVVLPTTRWLSEQTGIDERAMVDHASRVPLDPAPGAGELVGLGAFAHLFVAMLDRRTRCPIIADARFYLQLLSAALSIGFASFPCADRYRYYNSYGERSWGSNPSLGFRAYGCEAVGLARGIAFKATHEEVEKLLAEQVKLYFDIVRPVEVVARRRRVA